MDEREQNDGSFDPKTWGQRIPTAPPAPMPPRDSAAEPADTGFDVRQWGRDSSEASNDPSHKPKPPIGLFVAGGGGVLVLAVGAMLVLGRHPAPPKPAPPPPVAPVSKAAPGASRRTLIVPDPSAIISTMVSMGVAVDDAAEAGRRAAAALGAGKGELRLALDLAPAGEAMKLTRLEASRADGAGVVLTRGPSGAFAEQTLAAQLETKIRVVRGEMDSNSFYSSAVSAGVTDSLIGDFANAFSFDFDMQREVAPGDVFEAAFEQAVNRSGEAVGAPKLLYVSLSTPKKSRALYRFQAPGDSQPGWYDGNGRSTVRSLMRTPVDSARISSTFGMRTHPILGFQKLHTGTDFAAPVGTPIFASGNAVVEWAAMKGPNGNLTILRHDNGWQTYYLHQNMFMPGIVPGAHVMQGQKIGEIGTTGRSTGPHLHYEVHIDGKPVDPMSIDTGATGKTLAGADLTAFRKLRDGIDAQRAGSAS